MQKSSSDAFKQKSAITHQGLGKEEGEPTEGAQDPALTGSAPGSDGVCPGVWWGLPCLGVLCGLVGSALSSDVACPGVW